MRVRVFRYLPTVDAFDVTPTYRELAGILGLTEWSPVVWIGRLFCMDNDFGEHWFDNWEAREARRDLATRHGCDVDQLLIVDADRFQDGRDGPCHPAEIRARFWRDVLISLELEVDLLFDEARRVNAERKRRIDAGHTIFADLYLADLEDRIREWRRRTGP
jgi:hypothetical protein